MSRKTWPRWIKVKYVMLVAVYLCFMLQTIIRQCFVHSYRVLRDGVNKNITFDETHLENFTEFTIKIIGTMFYVGHATGHFIGGIISDIYGGRYPISSGVLVSSIITFIYPYAVLHTPWFFTGLMEFLIGFSRGFIVPAAYTILARWVPDSQLTVIVGGLDSTLYLGRLVMLYVTTYVIGKRDKWAYMFKIWGGVGVLLYIVLLIFVSSSPWQSKMATQKEKNVMDSIVGSKRPKKVNWKRILRDEAVWAITFEHVSHRCIFYVLTGETETLKNQGQDHQVFHMSTVFWLIVISCWVSTFTVNHLINERKMPIIYLRCICVALGSCIACLPLMAKSHISMSGSGQRVFRSLAFFLKGIHYASGQVNVLDLTRIYCGTIIGMQSAIAGIAGYAFKLAAAATNEPHKVISVDRWQTLYDFIFCMCVMTTLIYFIWARAEKAEWDIIVEEEEDEDEEFID